MSSPLVDFGKSIYNKLQPERRSFKKDDPSWHASKVSEANESFRRKGVGAKTSVAKQKAKVGQRKSSRKRY